MAARKNKIKNLDTLEKEIFRLRLEAKNKADKLEKNFDHLRNNYASMTMNTVFNRAWRKETPKETLKEKLFGAFWENEKVNNGLNKILNYLAEKTADGIESLLDKILNRKA